MEYILVSACLLGHPVRYNATARLVANPILAGWRAEGRIISFCPEQAAGGSVPRPPAEIVGENGAAVLDGHAEVVDKTGKKITDAFIRAADMALAYVKRYRIRIAVLADGSPSCGSTFIYNGCFSGVTKAGEGVVAARLRRNGVAVFGEDRLATAKARLSELLAVKTIAGTSG